MSGGSILAAAKLTALECVVAERWARISCPGRGQRGSFVALPRHVGAVKVLQTILKDIERRVWLSVTLSLKLRHVYLTPLPLLRAAHPMHIELETIIVIEKSVASFLFVYFNNM